MELFARLRPNRQFECQLVGPAFKLTKSGLKVMEEKLLIDVQKQVLVFDYSGRGETQQMAVIPLAQASHGVLVDLAWVRQMSYLAYDGLPLSEWRQKYAAARSVETPDDLGSLRLWPVVEIGQLNEATLESAFNDQAPAAQDARRVSLKELGLGLRFEDGVETSLMQYPELIALIDGVVFRFPEAYFIDDMEVIVRGGMMKRNPDWFRTFDGLPTRWRGRRCELCGHDGLRVRHIIGPSRIVQCNTCGLEFDNPQAIIKPAALDKYASDLHDRRKSAKSLVRAEQSAAILMAGLRKLAPELLSRPLLDLGCASGELLYVLREKYGWPNNCLWGIEPSPRSSGIAGAKYGLNVLNGELNDLELPDREFGVVVIVNTIEHFSRPGKVLARAHQLLAPDGCLMIGTVPNVASLASYSFPEGFIAKNFPDGQHHYQFTPDTLARLCSQAGFEIAGLDGETRDSVIGKVRETGAWLAYSCGIPLSSCQDEERMLHDMRDLMCKMARQIVEEQGSDYRFALREGDFDSVAALVEFWKREIWKSPHLSDEFDLWLRKRALSR